jgi:hypothetical protein
MRIEYKKPCIGLSLSEAALRLQLDDADCDMPVIAAASAAAMVTESLVSTSSAALQVYAVVMSS